MIELVLPSFFSLGKCSAEVSRSLEEVFHLGDMALKSKDVMVKPMPDSETCMENASGGSGNVSHRAGGQTSQKDDTSLDHTIEFNKSNQLRTRGIVSRRRRSSSGTLSQFVRLNSSEDPIVIINELGANEAIQRFRFRS